LTPIDEDSAVSTASRNRLRSFYGRGWESRIEKTRIRIIEDEEAIADLLAYGATVGEVWMIGYLVWAPRRSYRGRSERDHRATQVEHGPPPGD